MSDILQYLYDTSLATAMREGASLFPWIESIHVLAITLVVGTIAIVDLRLIGFSAHRRSANRLIRDMLPFTWGAFAVAVVTGTLMFIPNAPSYWANTEFRVKLCLVVLAGLNMAFFHLTSYRKIGQWDEAPRPPVLARAAGVTSLVLWILVIVFGRWIGFTLAPV
jgi:hypothetical protein